MVFIHNTMIQDSIKETNEHRVVVSEYTTRVSKLIHNRGMTHDLSKLDNPELEGFAEFGPKLKEMEYNSEEYKQSLKDMKPFLDHHYENNRHHPEHHPNGISDMNLIDLVEMICDWTASVKRSPNGDIEKSIEMNQKRFGYSDDLKQIFINTAKIL